MKIGIFTETFLPQVNGVVVSQCNINRELVKKGHKIMVFTVGDGPKKVDNYPVYRFRGYTFRPYPEYRYFKPNFLDWTTMKSKNLDVIHSRTPFTLGVTAKNLAKRTGKPIVGTFDTPITDYIHYLPVFGSIWPTKYFLEGIARKWTKKYYGWCDVVTAPSELTKKQLLAWGFENNIQVVSNGIDTKKYNPKNYDKKLKSSLCPNGEKLILHVGRITKEKKVESLLKIAQLLGNRNIKFKVLIIGNGPELERLKARTRSLGLGGKIIFAGYVPQKELPRYYASSDLFLTASTVETQGIVLLEALASGLPVVGANAGAIPELVKNRRNGLLFKSEGTTKATDCIEELLKDENLRKMLVKGTVSSIGKHSIGFVVSQVEKLYKSLI